MSDTYRGITLLSERERGTAGPGSDRYYLVEEVAPGVEYRRLPVEPRVGVPFDVDLGPDSDGEVVAAYSRCETEPDIVTVRETFGARVFSDPYPAYTTGRGCDIYRYDFETQGETLIEGASTSESSEVLPSIWRDEVAFTRVYEQRGGNRGVYPYLYVRPLDGGSSERQPGGSRGTNGLPGPTRLDLYGRNLSFVWNYSTRTSERAGTTQLRLDKLGADHEVLSSARHDSGTAYASYLGPNGYRGYIFYGFGRADFRDQDRFSNVFSMLLLNERISTGERDLADDKVEDFMLDLTTDSEITYVSFSDSFGYAADGGYTARMGLREYTDAGN